LTDISTFLYVIIFLKLQRLSMERESISTIIHTDYSCAYVTN
jgi:hypothetical protein